MNNQIESFYLSNDIPLDKKTKISSLTNINDELPIFHRYLGLIFYVTDIKKFYSFKNDINNPELLFADNLISNTFGIYVNIYSNIVQELNNYISLGKIIFVFPLNVAFYYDGTSWKYYSGIYNIRTNIDLNNLSDNLKSIGAKVVKDNLLYIWNESNNLSSFISNTIISDNLTAFNNPNQNINDRLYSHRHQLYKVIDNKVYQIGSLIKQFENFNINNGETKIYEILFTEIGDINLPPYINANLWIYNKISINNNTEVLIPIKLNLYYVKLIDRYEVWTLSDNNYSGTLEIKI